MQQDYAAYRQLLSAWADSARPVRQDTVPVGANDSAGVDAAIVTAIRRSHEELSAEILALIHAQIPAFFEALVIDVLVAMGYGGRRRDLTARLGRTGDGGIDGVVAQDELGLDLIYVQAKRLKPGTTVAVGDVRDFAGSLDARRANKGIFVATGSFSAAAVNFCGQVSRRVVLIDGARLADLMIRHNVGVRVKQSYQVKRVDMEYFTNPCLARPSMLLADGLPPEVAIPSAGTSPSYSPATLPPCRSSQRT